MPTFDQIRQMYPDAAGASDADIVRRYAELAGTDISTAASDFGVTQNRDGFVSSMKRTGAGFVGGVGEIVGDVTGNHRNALKNFAEDVEFRNPSEINSLGDIADNPWLATKVASANALSMLGPQALLGLATKGLQAYRFGRGAQVAAQAALMGVPSIGHIGEAQRESGEGENLALKYGTGLAVGGIENLAGVQRIPGIGRLLGTTPSGLPTKAVEVAGFGATPWKTAALQGGKTIAGETGEEILQNPLEQYASYKDPTAPEQVENTVFSGAMGALGSLGFGGYRGAQAGLRHSKINQYRQQDLLSDDTPISTIADQAQWNREFIARDQGRQHADDWYSQYLNDVNDHRVAEVIPRETYGNEQAELDQLLFAEHAERLRSQPDVAPSQYVPDGVVTPEMSLENRIANRPNNWEYRQFWDSVATPENRAAYEQYWGALGPELDRRENLQNTQGDLFDGPTMPASVGGAAQESVSDLDHEGRSLISALSDPRFAAPETQQRIKDRLFQIQLAINAQESGSTRQQPELRFDLPQTVVGNDLSLGNYAPQVAVAPKQERSNYVSGPMAGVNQTSGTLSALRSFDQMAPEEKAQFASQLVPYFANAGEDAFRRLAGESFQMGNTELTQTVARAWQAAQALRGTAKAAPAQKVKVQTQAAQTTPKKPAGKAAQAFEADLNAAAAAQPDNANIQELKRQWDSAPSKTAAKAKELRPTLDNFAKPDVLPMTPEQALAAKAAEPATEEAKLAAGWTKRITFQKDAQGNVVEAIEWLSPDEMEKARAHAARTTENEEVAPENIADPKHREVVEMHLAKDSTRAIAKAVGVSNQTVSNWLAAYGYTHAKTQAKDEILDTGSAFTTDENLTLEDGELGSVDEDAATDEDGEVEVRTEGTSSDSELGSSTDEFVDHELESGGVQIRSSPNSGGKVNATNDAVMASAIREVGVKAGSALGRVLAGKENSGTNTVAAARAAIQDSNLASRAEEAKRMVGELVEGNMDVAEPLIRTLGTKEGKRVIQLLRALYGMPVSIETPKAVVEYFAGVHAETQAEKTTAEDIAIAHGKGAWGDDATWGKLSREAQAAFGLSVRGYEDHPQFIQHLKGQFNEGSSQENSETAAGVPGAVAEAGASSVSDGGSGAASEGTTQKSPSVTVKKRRAVAPAEQPEAGNGVADPGFSDREKADFSRSDVGAMDDLAKDPNDAITGIKPIGNPESHPVLARAMRIVEERGLTQNFVFKVSTGAKLNAEGHPYWDGLVYLNENDEYVVLINEHVLAKGRGQNNTLLETVLHEISHAQDDSQGAKIYSSDRAFRPGGKIYGAAKKLFKGASAFGRKWFSYPFDPRYSEGYSAIKKNLFESKELFAQLMAAYYTNPEALQLSSQELYEAADTIAYEIENGYSSKSSYVGADTAAESGSGLWQSQAGSGARNSENAGRSVDFSRSGPIAQMGKNTLDRFLTDPIGAIKRFGLGWLTMENLVDVAGKVSPLVGEKVKSYQRVMESMQAESKKWIHDAAKIDQEWAKLSNADSERLSQVMRDARRAQFDPAKDTPTTAAQTALKAAYTKLPLDARRVYAAVRDHYATSAKARQTTMLGFLDKMFAAQISQAQQDGDTKLVQKLQDRRAKETSNLKHDFAMVKGPYFPLYRFGGFYAVGMSKQVSALLEKLEAGTITPQEHEQLTALKKDKKHYFTQSFDRESQAKAKQAELAGTYAESWYNEAEHKSNATKALSAAGLTDVEDAINAAFANTEGGKGIASKVKDILAEAYFDSLPEHHALKRRMKSENIHGEETNMRRVFAKTATTEAHYMSRLKFADALKEAMVGVRNTERRNPGARQIVNELSKRADLSMSPESDSKVVDMLVNASYFAHLGASPAFWLTNLLQTPMITMPWLTARYGFGASNKALAKALGDAHKIIKQSGAGNWASGTFDIKWDGIVSKEESEMLETLRDRNLIDITQEHDLTAVANLGGHPKWQKTLQLMNTPVRTTEVANRLITALAAYRLQMAKDGNHAHAQNAAAKAVSDTQLDYSALNTARHMQSVLGSKDLARVMMQFRKYQQGMLWLVLSNARNAMGGDKTAMKTLVGLAGTTSLMAGSLGIPLAGTLAAVLTALAGVGGDSDDPWDAETEWKNFLHDMLGKDLADVATHGLPAAFGMDLSKRVGMGDIASPLPFLRQGRSGPEKVGNTLFAAAGAPAGTIADVYDGMKYISQGQVAKGVERVVPLKAYKDISKAVRYELGDGMTDSKGNTILSSEDLSAWDVVQRGMGFAPKVETTYYNANNAIQTAKQAATDTRNLLVNQFVQARSRGDDVAGIQEKINAFNGRHPEKGVRIDGGTLAKAVSQARSKERSRNDSGVVVNKQIMPFAERGRFATP